jgi:two-component system, sensor histidine kinase PdtaS
VSVSRHLTECGLPGIKHMPYGMHACHFYRDATDLAEALVPYFIAGLRRHERCLWITANPLPAAEAQRLIEAAWEGAVDAIDSGALHILDYGQWYMSATHLKGLDVVKLWLEEEERALAASYTGLRITGNVTFLRGGEDWAAFMEYEKAVTCAFQGRRIVALCSYDLRSCSGNQAAEVMHAHACTLERPDASWQVLSPLPTGD